MIIDRAASGSLDNSSAIPELDLPALGIGPEHYEAIEKAVKALDRQGIAVRLKK